MGAGRSRGNMRCVLAFMEVRLTLNCEQLAPPPLSPPLPQPRLIAPLHLVKVDGKRELFIYD